MILDSYMKYELKQKVDLPTSVWRIFYFRFRFVYISLYFGSIKVKMNFFTLKRHNSFQNSNDRKATQSFPSRPLIFKLQQGVLKFAWELPKNWGSF